jgi:AcrR family transcriptional regulator
MVRGRKHPARAVGGVRDRRRARKREEILKAGLKVFAEKGYRAATMDDIALELEATKGLLYYHFDTKEQILNAILGQNQLIAAVEAEMVIPPGVPLAEALGLMVNRWLDLMESNGALIRFLHVQALVSGPENEFVYTQVLEHLYQVSARWIDTYKRTGEVRPDLEAETWGRLVVDFMSSYFLRKQIFGERARPPREYVNGVLQILLNGIATEKAKAIRRPLAVMRSRASSAAGRSR